MNTKISAEVVRKLRRDRSWTQDHLAYLCTTSTKTIQRVERAGICSLETRAALASAFDVDVMQLDGEHKIEQTSTEVGNEVIFLTRLNSGLDVVRVFEGSYWYRFNHETPRDAGDVDTVAGAVLYRTSMTGRKFGVTSTQERRSKRRMRSARSLSGLKLPE